MVSGIPAYAPLWCKSNYSFLEGASHPEELIEESLRLGIRSLALTDRDGVYGVVRAHGKAREQGFHLILGSQTTIDDGSILMLLAMDREGYANLCQITSLGRLRMPKGESQVTWREVCEHAGGLIALWGGDGSLLSGEPDPLFVARDLLDAFGDRLYAMIVRHRRVTDPGIERRVRDRADRYGLPLVAGHEVLYHIPSRRPLQDVLTCIRYGVTLSKAGTLTKPNAEHVLKSPHAFALLFQDDLYAVARTLEVASRCTFSLDEIRYRYPSEKLPDGTTSAEWLRHLTYEGARERYLGVEPRFDFDHLKEPTDPLDDDSDPLTSAPGVSHAETLPPTPAPGVTQSRVTALPTALPKALPLTLEAPRGIPAPVREQLEKELQVISELDYEGYFLTMWEIVQFCRRESILCQGRGSAANSTVCYCLGITAIDPVRMGLLFERFLSRERAEPPDIDLDIEHNRREEVIQWVYRKYGRTHAAMVANFVRFRTRSAVREVGKVLGFAETEVDRLAKLLPHYEGITTETLQQAGFDAGNSMHQHLLVLSLEIQDFPRHLSIHPGGFLLGHEPVARLVPTENATMEDRTVIQWDKEDLENLGLFKIDLLGLGALHQLHLAFDLLRMHWGRLSTMANIPGNDPGTFEMIGRGDTIGVFQIESRAQMAMLPRLKPRNYYDLVIEVSIVRPGPISGGMVHPYLRRRTGKERVEYPHPSLQPVLEKTLGIPLFQEQVMQLAVVAADYTPGEADQLRRDMAAWRSSGRIERHRERLITRMKSKGILEEFAVRVFEQIRGFGEYGFPESHAASFALIAYATAWIRCHFPDVFTCSLLNAQPMGFYTPATIVEDAKRHGVTILPVDIAHSSWDCTLELPGVPQAPPEEPARMASPDGARTSSVQFAVRLGLRYIKGMGERERSVTEAARADGPFRSIEDFAQRTRLDAGRLSRLAESGAFAGFEPRRRNALWQVRAVHPNDAPELGVELVETDPQFASLTPFETIVWDYDTANLSTHGHPLEPMRAELAARGLPDARTVNAKRHGTRTRYAGVVINRQRPGTAGGVTFMTLEDETGFVNLVVWKQVFDQYRVVVKTSPFLGVTGKLQVESGVVHLIARELWVPQLRRQPRSAGSRDFH